MKQSERFELDYGSGFSAGDRHRKAGKAPRKTKAKIDPHSHYDVGHLDGMLGKSHRYKTGKRKPALV